MKKTGTKRIYLDYAARAPETSEAKRAETTAAGLFGNPSSIHQDGVRAKAVLSGARGEIAKELSCHSDEIVFVGSGTESDNLAIMGVFKYARLSNEFKGKDIHIITTAIEHPAVLEACRHLEEVGAKITYLTVDTKGLVDLKELRAALRPETVLVSIAYANSEIGFIQPVKEIAKEIRHFKKAKSLKPKAESLAERYPLFHTDACQVGSYLNLNVEQLGVDLLTLNSTKLGGPEGTGLLFVRRGTPLSPMLYGGGQEQGLRGGTENVRGIAGFAAALKTARRLAPREAPRLTALCDFFIAELQKRFPAARINGSIESRLPNNVSVSFPKFASELLVLELDTKGISVSAGSACASAKDTGSHVLKALYGEDDKNNFGTVRFSFGRNTSKREVQNALSALAEIMDKYKPWTADNGFRSK